ncbi:MAG: thioredoxin domain-containing protein, partial [bacterium]|nr:thioredoxin domain-containing protein [bacterium]
REHSAQPRQRVPGRAYPEPSANQHHLGVFTDFECPACSCEAKRLRQQIVPLFDGTLAVSIRHYPLNDECNDDATGTAHPQACGAAYAAEAARHLGGEDAFWAMHDLLFAHRRELGPATYSSLAERLGLDVERFRQTVSSGDVRSIVREDVALATRLGVSATPALFLDGRRVTDLGRDNLVFWKAVADKWKASARDRRMAATNPKRK